jgi:hypothetical protein
MSILNAILPSCGVTIVYLSRDGWRWHSITRNGRTVAESGEAYTREGDATQAARDFGPCRFKLKGEPLTLPPVPDVT